MSPEATVHGTVASEALRPKTPAEVGSFICIAQTHRRKQKHVTMMESRQAQLTLEYIPEGLIKTKVLCSKASFQPTSC